MCTKRPLASRTVKFQARLRVQYFLYFYFDMGGTELCTMTQWRATYQLLSAEQRIFLIMAMHNITS